MGNKAKITALLAGTALISTGLVPASGQDASGDGLALTFGITSSLRVNDNLGLRDPSVGTTTLWDNSLTFGGITETPTARLSFDIGATIRTAAVPGRSTTTEIDDPFAALSYRLESQNSLLEADANYRKVSLGFSDPLLLVDENPDDGIDDQDLIESDGTRERYDAQISFESGRIDPFGYGLTIAHDRTEYSGTTDTALYDSRTTSAEAFLRLQFSPVLESRITAFWEQYDADNSDELSRRSTGATGTLSYEINPVTIATASLGYDKIEESRTSGTATTLDGITGALRLSRDIPTGNISAEISSDISTTGRRNTIKVDGIFERPRAEFSIGVGATEGDNGNVDLIGNIGMVHELANGTITASLDRSVASTDEGIDNISTRAALDYTTDLTPVSSLSFGLDYAEINEVGSSDTTAISGLSATYTHELTRDWDVSAGYEYRHRVETGENDRESNEFFLTIAREFSVR